MALSTSETTASPSLRYVVDDKVSAGGGVEKEGNKQGAPFWEGIGTVAGLYDFLGRERDSSGCL